MKKQFLILVLAVVSFFSVSAQNQDFPNALTFNAGLNFYQLGGFLVSSLPSNVRDNVSLKTTASYGLAYDRAINDRFSVGGSIHYNGGTATFQDAFQFKGQTVSGLVKGTYSRVPIMIRGLVHYGKNEKLDMYSGLGLGVSIWKAKVSGNGSLQTSITDQDLKDNLRGIPTGTAIPTAQLIAFGARYYPVPNIGIGGELAIGTPYFLALNVSYRFGALGMN
jgi:opacity protein-like surface antigen